MEEGDGSDGRGAGGGGQGSVAPTMSSFGLRLLDSVNMAEEGRRMSGDSAPTADPESLGDMPKTLMDIHDCRVETVVVYLDRAEVSRSFRTSLKPGENEVVLKKVSSCVDKDSIRVEVRGGGATITEVSFLTKQLSPQELNSHNAKEKELRDALEDLKRRRNNLWTKKHRLKKQRDVLDGFADNVMKAGASTPGNNEHDRSFLDTNVLQGMAGFFTLYEEQATRLDEELEKIELNLEEITASLTATEHSMDNLGVAKEDKEARELSILLETNDAINVELYISYVVSKAKWTPKYDIRVFSNDSTMKILYYGMVQQSTGEDWNDARLCLSTAMPSVGGIVPDLGTQRLAFKAKPPISPTKQRTSMFGGKRESKALRRSFRKKNLPHGLSLQLEECVEDQAVQAMALDSAGSLSVEEDEERLSEQKAYMSEVKESITSTMYEISRRVSIPSDNNPHKVSVAIIDLKPTFEYESVPKRVAHAYLKAKVKNTSPYALLAGPTNIFLDNNFIAKAELRAVSPSEDFTCSLGVDPGVRVKYRPVDKMRESSGIVSKTLSNTYRQTIELKNTHPEAVRILVLDQLPISTEEKIKVQLQEPVIKHPEKYDRSKPIRLNKMNNVEWDLEIAPGETKELTLKYIIEYPALEEVESCVVHITESQC